MSNKVNTIITSYNDEAKTVTTANGNTYSASEALLDVAKAIPFLGVTIQPHTDFEGVLHVLPQDEQLSRMVKKVEDADFDCAALQYTGSYLEAVVRHSEAVDYLLLWLSVIS